MTASAGRQHPSQPHHAPWFRRERLFRRHLILPPEHGAWIWLIGPFVVGVAAGGVWSGDIALCGAALLAAFFARQPITLLVKISTGRRSRRGFGPAFFWLAIDGALAAGLAAWLYLRGYAQLFWLVLPALTVFVWHLWLVGRRAERHQTGIQVVAAGVLALAAPAGYWVAGGISLTVPWILWLVMWLQAAASIVFVQLRLAQRDWHQAGTLRVRWARGRRALLYSSFNMAVALAGWALLDSWSGWLVLGFGASLADTVEGVLRPAVGARPAAVGIRQAISSCIFVGLAVLAFTSA